MRVIHVSNVFSIGTNILDALKWKKLARGNIIRGYFAEEAKGRRAKKRKHRKSKEGGEVESTKKTKLNKI